MSLDIRAPMPRNPRLERAGTFHVFEWRFMLTPLTVSVVLVEDVTHVIRWREVYVFGVRLVRWKLASR